MKVPRQGKERSSMIKRWLMVLVAAAGSGCGNPPGLFPVSGKVLYKGEPAAGAVVYFHRRAEPGTVSGPIPYGTVEDDGSFSLATEGLGHGARPGRYSVLVEWRDPSGDGVVPVKSAGRAKLVKRSRLRSGPDRLEGRYLDIARPRLEAEVKPESNRLAPFELAD
jgi:hypothetical protein